MNAARTIASARHIAIEPFKRSQYDRGSKKILVDGEEWGEIEMQAHGCHGPSYHISDIQGPLMVPRGKGWGKRKDELTEHSFRPVSAKSVRIANIGLPEDRKTKIAPTEDQLRDHVASLIEADVLRSPAVRQREVDTEHAKYTKRRAENEQKALAEFEARALAAIGIHLTTYLADNANQGTVDGLKARIIGAMRWAQTQ